MQTTTDLVCVGASYSGLACAIAAAKKGLRVTVLDSKHTAGSRPHTTGILVKEAAEHLNPPNKLVRKISGVRLYSPALDYIDLKSPGYYFMAADTPGLLNWYADYARNNDVQLRFNTLFRGAQSQHGVHSIVGTDISAPYLVGADGPRSAVAQAFNLSRNTEFLIGMELEYATLPAVDPEYLHVFIDSKIAPGYIAWLVPGVGITQLGLAARYPAHLQINTFVRKLNDIFGLQDAPVLSKRGGLIPVGGRVKNFATENVLLVGDAAGLVSPLTAGGIHNALAIGELAGASIADYLNHVGPNPYSILKHAYPRYFWKKLLRQTARFDPPNSLLNGLIANSFFKAFAQLVFFHHRGLFSTEAWYDLLGFNNK